jgi:peroxiredoxin family protein/TusA-related sulfurtransferase
VLEIHADDAAFPIDLKSWCRSSDVELLSLEQREHEFLALVRVPRKKDAVAAPPETTPASTIDAHSEVRQLDYRGRRCPEPILELAKAARGASGPLEVLADDPAFPLDLTHWCRSSGATVEVLSSQDSVHRVLVFPRGAARATQAKPQATARIDLRELPVEALDEELTRIGELRPGMAITLLVPGSASQRVVRWCAAAGHELLAYGGGEQIDLVLARERNVDRARARGRRGNYDCVLLVMHNDLESLLGALLVANIAAGQGQRVMMFFTFWGLNLLRADRPNLAARKEPVSPAQRLFKWMMPKGPGRQSLGKLNFGGAGSAILQGIMKKKDVKDLPSLLATAKEQKVRFVACTMSMTVMGITERDLEPYAELQFGGVSTFVEEARHAPVSLVF